MPFSGTNLPLNKTDRRVYGALEVLVALLALAYVGYAVHRYATTGEVVSSDFPFFWVASHIDSNETLRLAYSGKLFSLEAARAHWGDAVESKYFAYPPHFLLALRPLAALSFGAAFVVWSGVGLAILTLAVWATFGRSWPVVRFTLLAPAALFCLVLGQTGLIMSALCQEGEGHQEAERRLEGQQAEKDAGQNGTSFEPVTMAARLIGLTPTMQHALQALAVLGVLAGVVWAFRREAAPGLCAALLFIGTMLASPFSLSYDMSMVSVAVWLLLQDMARGETSAGGRIIAVLTWTLPVWVYVFNEAHVPVGPPVLAAAFALAVARLYGRRPPDSRRHYDSTERP